MSDIKIAILGTGFIAEFRAQVYQRLAGVKIVGVMGRDIDKSRAFADRIGATAAASSFEDLLGMVDFDAVDICLPNHLHREFGVKAAKAGKHILCEKPLARNAAEAQELVDAVEAAGVINIYGENMIFSPDFQEIISIVKQGTLGKPLWMRGREAHFGPHSSWFYKKELSGGGALVDMGCHLIGIFNHILGHGPEQVFAHTPTLHHQTDCDDNALALLRYPGGVVGQCEASWTQRGGMAVVFEIQGEDGTIAYDRSAMSQPIKVYANRPTERYFSEKAESNKGWLFPTVDEYWRYGYYNQINHYLRCIRGEEAPLLTFRDGLLVNQIMDAAYASNTGGNWQGIA